FLPVFTEIMAARNGDETSIERYRKAHAKLATTKFKTNTTHLHIDFARSSLKMGHRDHAIKLAVVVQDMIEKTGENVALSSLHRLQAAISLAAGDIKTTEKHLGTALDVARQQGAKLWELRAAIDLARLWHEQGRVDEAITVLAPVHKGIADGDCPEDQAIARNLLADLAG
ncbi:MAG: hypothetical protein ABJV68_17565, partial [Paracoccaceae bacterium]